MAYKYPICDVFHWFCKIARFFATEPRNYKRLYKGRKSRGEEQETIKIDPALAASEPIAALYYLLFFRHYVYHIHIS